MVNTQSKLTQTTNFNWLCNLTNLHPSVQCFCYFKGDIRIT